MGCPFCQIAPDKYLLENEHFFVIKDIRPVSPGHTLVVSKRHVKDFFGLNPEEMLALRTISAEVKAMLDQKYHSDGYNLAMNCGRAAAQSVFHFHLHFIPRYGGDNKSLRILMKFIREVR